MPVEIGSIVSNVTLNASQLIELKSSIDTAIFQAELIATIGGFIIGAGLMWYFKVRGR